MGDRDFDAVVIGSGFGGSVSAYRLANAGERVCVLERGKAYPPGSFPRTPHEISNSFWDPSEGRYGLYNVWSFPGLGALVSSGLGGGSLIYANVMLRKDPETFERDEHESWPIRYQDLESHYEDVEEVLNAQRYPIDQPPFDRARKAVGMRAAAERLDQRLGVEGTSWQLPKLAITFQNDGQPPATGVPIEGAPPSTHDEPHPRLTCTLTGECDLGCNYGSKNTLDLNYLGLARQAGAAIKPCCEATWMRPIDGGGYEVKFIDHGELAAEGTPRRDLPEQTITADRLVLAAGTFGSNYLLLKCRDEFRLSSRLGERFSGNGDLLTFLLRARTPEQYPYLLEASYGPVITSAIHVPKGDGRRGHYVQDAGYPVLASWLAEASGLHRVGRRFIRLRARQILARLLRRTADVDLGAEFGGLLGDAAMSSSSMPLLSMGRDIPSGRFELDQKERLTTSWSARPSAGYFSEVERTLRAIAEELRGEWRDSRFWPVSKLVTVHPLGGCAMGRDAGEGVVDPHGEVFEHPGFFIADGSVMPGPVGPNPSLTIAALADRFADRMLA